MDPARELTNHLAGFKPLHVNEAILPIQVPPAVDVALYKTPVLKRSQSDLCLAGRNKIAKSVVPDQVVEHSLLGADMAATIAKLQLEPSPPSLQEVREVKVDDRAIRRKIISFIRERTKVREEKMRKLAAERSAAEKWAAENQARAAERVAVDDRGYARALRDEKTKRLIAELTIERMTAEKQAAEKVADEARAAHKLAVEKLAAEELAVKKLTAKNRVAKRVAAKKLVARKLAVEKLMAEKLAAKKLAAEKLAAEELAAADKRDVEATEVEDGEEDTDTDTESLVTENEGADEDVEEFGWEWALESCIIS